MTKTLVALALLGALALPFAMDAQAPSPRIKSLRIHILSTMLADEGFGEWGFAALVEVDGQRLLFDTGGHPDTVQRNLRELGLDVSNVERVILTHNHADHTAGLVPLRRELKKTQPRALARTWVGDGIFLPRVSAEGKPVETLSRIKTEYEREGGQFVTVSKPVEIVPGAWLTGPVPRVHPERNWSSVGQVRTARGLVEDTIPEDQALVFDTDKGLVVLFGCGHAGVINTLEYATKSIKNAPVYAVIGGMHLFGLNDEGLAWAAGKLKDFGLKQMMGAHCTGIEAVFQIREKAGLDRKSCVVGSVGATYTLDKGIDPLRIAR